MLGKRQKSSNPLRRPLNQGSDSWLGTGWATLGIIAATFVVFLAITWFNRLLVTQVFETEDPIVAQPVRVVDPPMPAMQQPPPPTPQPAAEIARREYERQLMDSGFVPRLDPPPAPAVQPIPLDGRRFEVPRPSVTLDP